MSERVPPSNREAEQAIIGAMLIDRAASSLVMEELQEEDFFAVAHRQIFAAALTIYNRGEPIDLITLSGELRRSQRFDEVGGYAYLNDLSLAVPTTANLALYIREVKEQAILRQLIAASSKISNLSFAASEPVVEILATAEREIMEISARGGTQKPYASLAELLAEGYEQLSAMMTHKGNLTGVPTGFDDLDKLTSGLQPSDLVIIASRPGVGKSTILLNMAHHAAVNHNVPTLFFSLEMSRDQLAQRLLCSSAKVDLYNLRNGFLNDREWQAITNAIGPLAAAPIYIDDTGALSVTELRSRVRRMKLEFGIGLVLVDYLQLMTLGGRPENRQQEISFISRSLKALAKETNLPVVAASQLSRAVEQRNDKRPVLSDLSESGGIEANADLVLFLYRDDYYNKDSDRPNTAELTLAKQRNGPTGTVELFFLKQFNKFASRERK